MQKIQFDNTLVNDFENSQKTHLALECTDSTINNINFYTSIVTLEGSFTTDFSIYDSSNVFFHESLELNNSTFLIEKFHEAIPQCTLVGTISNKNPLLQFKVSPGQIVIVGLTTFSLNEVAFSPAANIPTVADTYIIRRSINEIPPLQAPIPILINSPSSGSLTIGGEIKNIDFSNSKNLELIILPNSSLHKYVGLEESTLNSISAEANIINSLQSNITFPLPVKSLLLNVNISSGHGIVSIPNEFITHLDIPASIYIGNKIYNLSNQN